MIEINELSFLYGDEEISQKSEHGISGIDLHITSGECVLLCGESGCGKTTLTKTINGLIPHFEEGRLSGSVTVDGKNVSEIPMYELSKVVSSVFQNPKTQFFNTDAESEITFALENQGIPVDVINKKLSLTVESLGIEHLIHKSMFAMSGGEKQIIAFAGAFISNAKVIVLDEPSANLDSSATEKIRDIIKKMKDEKKTIIIAEHRIAYLCNLVDTICYVKDGKITETFSTKEFYNLPDMTRSQMGLRQLTEAPLIKIKNTQTFHNENTLEIKNLVLTYGKTVVARQINFTLHGGDIVGIVGKNGVGKSTLSRVICGLHKQKSGEVIFNGDNLNPKMRRKTCGIVMQDVNYQLFSDSVIGECMLGSKNLTSAQVDKIMKDLGLLELCKAHPQSLSGGQKQRLAIATVLASDKKVLILDEPTSGLDYKNMIAVSELLRSVSKQGIICIVITHDTEFLQATCNRCLRLEQNGITEINEIVTS